MMAKYTYFGDIMKHFTRSFLSSFLIFTLVAVPTFAASENYEDTVYSSTEKANQEISAKYYTDSAQGLSEKLNTMIKGKKNNNLDPGLESLLAKTRGGDIFTADLDKRSAEILPGINQGENSNFSFLQIASSLNKNIGHITPAEGAAIDKLVGGSLQSLKKQTDISMSTEHDLKNLKQDADGKVNNSSFDHPFDLVADMQKIMKLFVKDPIEYEGFVNTMGEDAGGLITGRFETGNWAQGKEYEIDLASDISSALGQKKAGSAGGGGDDKKGSDCSSGFCITLDIITNDSYSGTGGGGGGKMVDANYEEILGSANEWLIKKGDKRNIACKTAPPKNHFQSNNDLNLFFKNIFRGLGIFVFTKTPPYAKSKSGTRAERTALQKEKDTSDLIDNNLKERHVDKKHLLLGTPEQAVMGAALAGSATPASAAQKTADAVRKTRDNQQLLKAREDGGSNALKAIVNTTNNSMAKDMGRTLGSWMTTVTNAIKSILDSIKYINNLPPCQN